MHPCVTAQQPTTTAIGASANARSRRRAQRQRLHDVGREANTIRPAKLGGLAGRRRGDGDGNQQRHRRETGCSGATAIEGVHEGGDVEGPLRQGREEKGDRVTDECLVVERRPLDRADISVGLMRLTPTDRDRLLIFTAAELARSRRARGLRLNVPEATALIADTVCEAARDGARLMESAAAGASRVDGR